MSGRFWLGTLYQWNPPNELPGLSVVWIKGQQECCPTTGRLHHQIIAGFKRQVRLATVKREVGEGHWEVTRSVAADEYVWKEDTRVEGTQFELGAKPLRRNVAADWDSIRTNAKSGEFDLIPSDVFVRYYGSICRIFGDYARPTAIERTIHCFWGATGTGKSFRAWEEAGVGAYAKDPRSKWWCGYRGETAVIIDEFRGGIDISHVLRWFDRYPVLVEVKGSARPLLAERIWITSNVDPRGWYPELDQQTLAALLRRLNIIHFNYFFYEKKVR